MCFSEETNKETALIRENRLTLEAWERSVREAEAAKTKCRVREELEKKTGSKSLADRAIRDLEMGKLTSGVLNCSKIQELS